MIHSTQDNVLDFIELYVRFIPETIIVLCYSEKINVESVANIGFLNADEF